MADPNGFEKYADLEISKETLRDLAKAVVLANGQELDKDEKIEQVKAIVKLFEEGKDPAGSLGMTDRDIANIYSYGFSLYNSGKYEEAKSMFLYLLTIVPFYPCFSQAAAVAFHRLKDYKNAAHYYLQAAFVEKTNPMHYFYAYDCFKEMNEPENAMEMIATTITLCKTDKKYEKVQANAEVLVEGMLQQHPDLFERVKKE